MIYDSSRSFRSLALLWLAAGSWACVPPTADREDNPPSGVAPSDGGIDPAPSDSGPSTGSVSPGDDSSPDDDPAAIVRLQIEPQELLVRLDIGKPESVDYKAIGTRRDGETRDLSDKVDWELAESELGSFDGASLRVTKHDAFFIGTSRISARYQGLSALAQMTVAAYHKSGDNPDFLFVVPFEDPKGDQSAPLTFSTQVPALDVFFNVDTTQSMGDELDALRESLQDVIVPQVQKSVPNTQFGVGGFEDFPSGLHGSKSAPKSRRPDQPFRLEQVMTDEIEKVQAGVDALQLGSGADPAESALESLYQIATGEGLSSPGVTSVAPNSDGIGGVAFNKGTMPVIVTITDAVSHAPGETQDGCGRDYNDEVTQVAHTRAQTEAALEEVCARVIYVASAGGIQVGDNPQCTPETDGISLAKATGARVYPAVWDKDRPSGCKDGECCTGINGKGKPPEDDGLCSLVYSVDAKGQGLGETVVSGISSLAFYAQFSVTTDNTGEKASLDGEPLPDGVTTLDFIQSITAEGFGKPPLEGLPDPKPSGDKFEDVTPGTPVEFKMTVFNDVVREQPGESQVFRARIKVLADQCEGLSLDEREVTFIVPPAPLPPPG